MKRVKFLLLLLPGMFFLNVLHLQAQAYRMDETDGGLSAYPQADRDIKMPVYPTGADEMLRFIEMFLIYPKDAIKNKIEGRVIVRFMVAKDGYIKDIKVIKSLSLSCDKEAMRVVSIMPKWIPGEIKGESADIEYTLPIRFGVEKKSEMILNVIE